VARPLCARLPHLWPPWASDARDGRSPRWPSCRINGVTRTLVGLLGFIVLLAPVVVAAHPGHDPIAVTGTLLRVLPERIEVDTFDTTSMQKRTMSIVTDEYTKWKLGKKSVDRTELAAGTPVVVAFTHAELKDGTDGLVALEIRGREVKKKKS
jgi:hypothetical protein